MGKIRGNEHYLALVVKVYPKYNNLILVCHVNLDVSLQFTNSLFPH